MLAHFRVRGEHCAGRDPQRQQPVRVYQPQMRRARPNRFLIARKFFQQMWPQ